MSLKCNTVVLLLLPTTRWIGATTAYEQSIMTAFYRVRTKQHPNGFNRPSNCVLSSTSVNIHHGTPGGLAFYMAMARDIGAAITILRRWDTTKGGTVDHPRGQKKSAQRETLFSVTRQNYNRLPSQWGYWLIMYFVLGWLNMNICDHVVCILSWEFKQPLSCTALL